MNQALAKAFGMPFLGVGFFYVYLLLSKSGGIAGNFAHYIVKANEKFYGNDDQKWPSKKNKSMDGDMAD